MADHIERRDGSTRFKKSVSKLAFRGKERMMRSLGMGEETKDEIIDNYVHLVNKQQAQFIKFQRDVKMYVQAINAMKAAADNFYKSLNEIYDDNWVGKDMISSLAKTTELLFDNLASRINGDVSDALQLHLNQCQQVKHKVQKRGRKLVDFDGAKRSYYTLKNTKKVEDVKLTKAQEHVDHSRGTYETLNTQLHQELPDLHDFRVVLSTDIIGTIASSEKEFFTELAEIRNKLLHVSLTVKNAYESGDYRIQRLHSSVSQQKVSQQPTLPSDAVLNARNRGDSDSFTDRSMEEDANSFSETQHAEQSTVTPVSKRRPNDYVNIQIGDDGGAAVNGHTTEESQSDIYDAVHEENQHSSNVENEVSASSNLQSTSGDRPKPAPRDLTQEKLTQEDQESYSDKDSVTLRTRNIQEHTATSTEGEDSDTASNVFPAKVSSEQSDPSKQLKDSAAAKSPAVAAQVVMRRAQSQSNEEKSAETSTKRSSFLAGASLSRFLSRSSKATATQDDTAVKTKKGGFFSIFRKDKSTDKEMPVMDRSATLPPPKLLSKLPPRERSSSSSFEDAGHDMKTTEFPSFSSNVQQMPSQSSVDVKFSSYENKEEARNQESVAPLSNGGAQGSLRSDTSSFSSAEDDLHNEDQVDGKVQVVEREAEDADEYVDVSPQSLQDKTTFLEMPQTIALTVDNASFEREQVVDTGEYQNVVVSKPSGREQELKENSSSEEDYENVAVGPSSALSDIKREEEDAEEAYDDVVVGGLPASRDQNMTDEKEEQKDTEDTYEDVVAAEGSGVRTSIPAYTQVNKISKWNKQGSTDSASSENKFEEPNAKENVYSYASEEQQTRVKTSETFKTDSDGKKQDAENDSDLSSYHSSLIPSARSSVSLSDEISSPVTVNFQSQDVQKKLGDVLHGTTGASSSHESSELYVYGQDVKSDLQDQHETSQKRISAYENVEIIHQRQSPTQSANESLSHSAGAYISLQESHLHSKAPPASAEFEDDYEDTVYDTIVISNPADTNDSQAIYDMPDNDSMPASQTKDTSKAEEILPPHFLYKAVAMYPYQSTDDDELNFCKGDLIYVVEFPDPEEQDEGWQMGILKSSWEDTQSAAGMGVFPENFTRRL